MVFVEVVVASLVCAALLEMHARSSAAAPPASRGSGKDFVVRALLVAVAMWGVLYWTGASSSLDDAVYNMQLGEPDF